MPERTGAGAGAGAGPAAGGACLCPGQPEANLGFSSSQGGTHALWRRDVSPQSLRGHPWLSIMHLVWEESPPLPPPTHTRTPRPSNTHWRREGPGGRPWGGVLTEQWPPTPARASGGLGGKQQDRAGRPPSAQRGEPRAAACPQGPLPADSALLAVCLPAPRKVKNHSYYPFA